MLDVEGLEWSKEDPGLAVVLDFLGEKPWKLEVGEF
jgi:hypothetical protein